MSQVTPLNATDISLLADSLIHEIGQVIVGKRDTIQKSVLTLLCEGHLLIEDVPGVGKTTLAKAIAIAMGGEFRRVQFTPDLLPSDVTGGSIYNQREHSFEFRPGPLFANVVLVDEINRATPKTQSALLEAMEERQVTLDGVTHQLPRPFLVIATQNNVEMTGTFPLPEAQLDRFFARVSLGYPDFETESEVLRSQQVSHPLEGLRAVTSQEAILAAIAGIKTLFVHDSVREYAVSIVRATRDHGLLALGASPRGSLYLLHAAQAHAAMTGRDFVSPDDVKAMATTILGHRVIVRGEVRARGMSNIDVIDQVLSSVAVPVPVA